MWRRRQEIYATALAFAVIFAFLFFAFHVQPLAPLFADIGACPPINVAEQQDTPTRHNQKAENDAAVSQNQRPSENDQAADGDGAKEKTDRQLAAYTCQLVKVGWTQAGLFMFQAVLFIAQAAFLALGFRASARAANVAERSLIDYERPWIFRDIVTVTWRNTPGVRYNDWTISLKWKNVGRMPAMITECVFEIEEVGNLPARPDYRLAHHLNIVGSLTVGQDFDTNPVGPATGDTVMRELVFFGRLTYREMNGTEHHSGFGLRLVPFAAGTIEHGADAAYNYYN